MTEGTRLVDLAAAVGGRVRGNPERLIRGVATLEDAGPDDLSFFTNVKYRESLSASRAGAILVGPGVALDGRDVLEAPEPYLALAEILARFEQVVPVVPGISTDARIGAGVTLGRDVTIDAFAVVGQGAMLGDRVVVGAGTVIGAGCTVGEATQLRPRVVLYPGTRVGARCLLHAGVVLGADGFGFATSKGLHRKVPQLGRVVVEDDVEIGANSTVDRGTLGETRIGAGTKIDNLVMIAHGVVIGANGLFAAQSGIAGSTRIGRNVTFAGQAGAAGHVSIGDGAIVAAKTAVFEDIAAKAFVAGIPAIDHRSWKRAQASFKALPELRAKVRALEERLAAIASQAKGER